MEVWKQIPGFSRYSASSLGRVRRDVKVYRTAPGICALHVKQGYPSVCATDDAGRHHTIHVHALVMRAFVGHLPEGMHVCHADGDRSNNAIANLRYDTPTANVRDAIKHGTQVKGEAVAQHILTEQEVREIVLRLEGGATYEEAAHGFPITKHCVYRIAAGRTWKHVTGGKDRRNGYKFNSRGALAAKAKRKLARVAKLDDGADQIKNGARVWEAIA